MGTANTVFSLKPEVSAEADWRIFRDTVSRSTTVYRFFSSEGQLEGFWEHRVDETTLRDGRRVLAIVSTYTFFAPGHRGTPWFLLALLASLLPLALRSLRTPVLVLGAGYPMTYLFAVRRGIWPVLDGEAPPGSLEALVLEAYREECTGVRSEQPQPVVSMRTLPELPAASWLARATDHPGLRKYEQINPRWREGFAVFGCCHINGTVFAQFARGFWGRLRQPPARR